MVSWQSCCCTVCIAVHSRVYVHLLWLMWHTQSRCLEHCSCAGMYATQVLVDTSVHICEQVCMLHRCQSTPVYICANILSVGCAHAFVYAQFVSLMLGDEDGGLQLDYAEHLLLAWKVIFDMRKMGVLSVFSLFFDGGWSLCGCMCAYTHTHTHTAREVLG